MKKKIMKIGFLLMLTVFLTIITLVSAEPTIDNIDVNPENPEPLSTVTITCDITADEEIQGVKAIFEECKTGFCYTGEEITLSSDTGSTYTGDFTLSHDDANSLKYHVEVKTGDTWTKSETTQIDLSTGSNGGNNNGDNSNDTPGFTMIVFIASVFIFLVILSKKRLR